MPRVHLKAALAIAIAILAVPANAPAQTPMPQSPPPDAARAILHGNQLFLNYAVVAYVMETKDVEVEVEGKKEQRTVMVCRSACQRRMGQVPTSQCRVFTVGGQRLSDEQAAARLVKETDVLYTQSGKLLDPAYRVLYPPETLVVYAQPQQLLPGHGAMAIAAPPPPDAPQPPAEAVAAPPPAPKFAEIPPDQGPPPQIGFLEKAGDQATITTYAWRSVREDKPISVTFKDAEGTVHKVTKEQAVIHWLPQGQAVKFNLVDLAAVDTNGKPRGDSPFSKLAGGQVPVLISAPDQPFDANHYKPFRAGALIVRADVQPAMSQQEFPNFLPPQGTFAKVTGDHLTIYSPVYETRDEAVPVKVALDGKEVTQVEHKNVIMTKTIGSDFPLADVKASDAAGKAVDAATLAQRLAKESLVLAWESGWPVGDIYLTPVKPDTLNLVLPPPTPLAPGQARPPAPEKALAEGLPPRFALAQLFGDLLVLREPQVTTIQVPKTVTKIVDGEQIAETVLEDREGTYWDERAISWDDFRFASADGQSLDYAKAKERLAKETMVLVSDQGKKVDLAWLTIYQPEAVIVYLRPRGFGGYDPAPAPVRPAPIKEIPQPAPNPER